MAIIRRWCGWLAGWDKLVVGIITLRDNINIDIEYPPTITNETLRVCSRDIINQTHDVDVCYKNKKPKKQSKIPDILLVSLASMLFHDVDSTWTNHAIKWLNTNHSLTQIQHRRRRTTQNVTDMCFTTQIPCEIVANWMTIVVLAMKTWVVDWRITQRIFLKTKDTTKWMQAWYLKTFTVVL